MKKSFCVTSLVAALAVSACASTANNPVPVSPAIITDAQLVVSGLQAVDGILVGIPGVPAGDVGLANAVLTAISGGLAQAQSGTITNAALANIIAGQVSQLSPVLLTDLKANQTITAGVNAITAVLPTILADAGLAAPAKGRFGAPMDPRGTLQAWISAHPPR